MGQGASSRLRQRVRFAAGAGTLGVLVMLMAPGGDLLAADLTGRKGLGGSVGSSLMIGDWQFRAHARPRLTGDAVFRYGFHPHWAIVASFGYGWNSYSDEERWLSDPQLRQQLFDDGFVDDPKVQEKVVIVSPFVAGVEYRLGKDVWVPYIGAGGGIYQLQIAHNGSVAIDPRNLARQRRYDFGLCGRLGVEQFLSESVSLEYEGLLHIIFSEDRKKFPPPSSADQAIFGRDFRDYGGDAQLIQIRFGVRYYWGEGEEGAGAGGGE